VSKRLGTVLALCVGLLFLLATEASAHAELIETNPGNGAHLDRAPAEVRLRFSETVTPVRGGFTVVDGNGRTVASPAGAGDGSTVRLALPGSLGDGVYVVNWRVVSADSHPVHGAFVFSVGSARAAPLADAGAQAGSDALVGAAFWLFRLLGYLGLAMVIGGAFFIVACWPAGRTDPGARRLLRISWIVALGSAVGVLLLQGPNAVGSALLTALDPSLVRDTLGTSYGVWVLARIVLLVATWYVLGRVLAAPVSEADALPRKEIAVVTGLGVVLAVTWSVTGHPAAAGGWAWAALPLDALHLVAVSIWLGGLAVLAGVTLGKHRRAEEDEAASAVSSYSRSAAVSVVVLGTTGLLQAVREIAASGLGGEYFTLLVFKVGAFGLVIWLAALSRSAVQSRLSARTARQKVKRKVQQDMLGRLRQSVRWEAGIAAVVLGLTAALVATPPGGHDHGPAAAAAETADAGPFQTKISLPDKGDVQVWVDPAHTGSNQIVVNVRNAQGVNQDVPEVTGQLRLADGSVGPLQVALAKTGTGQFVANAVAIPVAGTWQLTLNVRTTEFNESTVDAQLIVPGGS
jgi:copper transport protein